MATRPTSVRMPEETRRAIEETCRRTGRDFSSVVNEMLSESVKMRRIPGIMFANSTVGRVARIAGTGLEVWEVVRAFQQLDESWLRLKEEYPWLSDVQLRSALAYAEAYPDEIDRRIQLDEQLTPDEIWSNHPFMAPRTEQ